MESLSTNGHLKTEDMAHGLDIDPDSARFSMEDVRVELQCADLWRRFHDIGTEMIVTKAGRRMFPVVRVKVTGLDPHQQYFIAMDIIPVDNKRYRYVYRSSEWTVAGMADPPAPPASEPAPRRPAPGHTWSTQVISFHKLKLTNNLLDQQGHVSQPIVLHSMHKYLPRVHVIRKSMGSQLSPTEPVPTGPGVRSFSFPQTVFTTVTAYQNQQITRLKIDRNPFAKGFRDSGRNRTGLEAVMESYAFCRSPVRTLRFEDSTSMPKQRGGSTGSSPSPSGPAPHLAPGGYGTRCRDRPLCGVGQSEYSPCAWSHDHAPNHTPDHTLPDYSCLTDRSCARQQTDSYPQQRTCSSLVPTAMQAPCMVGTGAGSSVDARGGRQLGSFPDSQLQCTMQAGEGPNPCGSAPAGHMASAGQCAGFPLHGHYGYAFSSPLSANGVKPASPQAPPLTPCPAAGFAERQDTPTHRTGRSTGSAQQGADSWKADVSLVVGARLQDEGSVRALVLAVQLPARRLFTVITWEDTLEKIHELGNPKAKKPKDVPMFHEVMESAKAVLDEGEELPAHLLGKVVKFQLLVAKGNHLQRRTMAGEEKVKGKARAGSSSKEKGGAAAKAAGKAEKGKKASEPPPPAKETTLKRRGEREETSTPIDDEPADGPQLYVLMVGFLQPQLVAVLDLLGVRVSNIIQVSSPHPSIPPGPPQHQPQHEPQHQPQHEPQHPPQHAPELGTSPTPQDT
ncbi:T-box transcription factor TBX15-like, partial [Conger conger]|uniref:T-box transcription factor TBX15-like n=1 Tax=Conger conger TaxID=82655 RepID=UPI002A5A37C4